MAALGGTRRPFWWKRTADYGSTAAEPSTGLYWIGLFVLVLLAAAALFVLSQMSDSEAAKDAAVGEAAQKVGDAAEQVGDSAVETVLAPWRTAARDSASCLRSQLKSLSCLADESHRADKEQDRSRGGQIRKPIHHAWLAAEIGDCLHQLNRCAK